MTAVTLVQKLWNYCNILRDDGLSYGDYVEQLTYLLFLKWPMSKAVRRSTNKVPSRKDSVGIPSSNSTATISKRIIVTPSKNWANGPACSGPSSAKPKTKSRTRPNSAA